MPLSPVTQRAFDMWMGPDTWAKGHPSDEGRFYNFVWAVARYSRRPIGAAELRDLIFAEWEGRIEEAYLQDKAMSFSNRFDDLLDFARARNAKQFFLPSDFE